MIKNPTDQNASIKMQLQPYGFVAIKVACPGCKQRWGDYRKLIDGREPFDRVLSDLLGVFKKIGVFVNSTQFFCHRCLDAAR